MFMEAGRDFIPLEDDGQGTGRGATGVRGRAGSAVWMLPWSRLGGGFGGSGGCGLMGL